MKISMKLVYQYIAIFFNFPPTSSHLRPLQAENCDSNSRLVVDEDDNGKFRHEKLKPYTYSSGNTGVINNVDKIHDTIVPNNKCQR